MSIFFKIGVIIVVVAVVIVAGLLTLGMYLYQEPMVEEQ